MKQLELAIHARSFDDFPVQLAGESAHNLLHCWCAMWHPVLLANALNRPSIACHRRDANDSDDHGDESIDEDGRQNRLIVVPEFLQGELDSSWRHSVEQAGGMLVNGSGPRREIAAALMNSANLRSSQPCPLPELIDHFFALGYAWLQVRLMTLHVRYSTHLNDQHFDQTLLAAARQWQSGDEESTRTSLAAAFDLLLEEKNRYYPVQPDLIDLVLIEESTLGPSLSAQLHARHHINLLLTGRLARLLSTANPDALTVLKQRLCEDAASVIGGLEDELPSNLIPLETQLRQFTGGRQSIREVLDVTPQVFLRRRFGLTPATPDFLESFDFEGAFHFTLDGGKFPAGTTSVLRWESPQGNSVPAIASLPVDAADAAVFLDLGIRIARSLDSEHMATVVFAHWPDLAADFLTDLQTITNYGPLFGEFQNVNHWFANVYDPGYGDSFTADDYQSPLYRQAVAKGVPDPVSRFVDFWRLSWKLAQQRFDHTLSAIRQIVDSKKQFDFQQHRASDSELDDVQEQIESLVRPDLERPKPDEFAGSIAERLEEFESAVDVTHDDPPNTRRLVIKNANWFPVSTLVTCRHDHGSWPVLKTTDPDCIQANLLAPTGDCETDVVVSLPATGRLVLHATNSPEHNSPNTGPPVDDQLLLRNEFFQIQIDAASGGIRSWQTWRDRTTLASQRLSIRLPAVKADPKRPVRYANMVAREIRAIRCSPIRSSIVSQGSLIDPATGDSLANFVQTVTVGRGDRIATIGVEIEPLYPSTSNPGHYICSRLAWQEDTATLGYGTPEVRANVQSEWIDAPAYIRIQQANHHLTLLTGGLPWHRRSSRKILDSILVVGNESRRKFSFGLADRCGYDLRTAISWMNPPRVAWQSSLASDDHSANGTDWLFHIANKNVVVLSTRLIAGVTPGGSGIEIRLLESEGRRGTFRLTCPFSIAEAQRVSFSGRIVQQLEFGDNRLEADFRRNEYFQIRLYFDRPAAGIAHTPLNHDPDD